MRCGETRPARQVVRSARVLGELTSGYHPDMQIPRAYLSRACGLAFVTQVKAGLLVSGAVGSGLVVRRQRGGGWSMPVSVFTLGAGIGAQVGGRVTDAVIIMLRPEAVDAFCARGPRPLLEPARPPLRLSTPSLRRLSP